MSSTTVPSMTETINLTNDKNDLDNFDLSILLDMDKRLKELKATEMAASSRKLIPDIIAMRSTNVKQRVDVLRQKQLVQRLIKQLQSFKGYYVHDEIQLWNILLHMIKYTVSKPMALVNELVGDTPLELYVKCIDKFDCQDPNETKRALKSISGTITQLLKARCSNPENVTTTINLEPESCPCVNSTGAESMKEKEGEEKVENATSRIENLTMQPTNSTRKSDELPIVRKPFVHQVSYIKLTSWLNKLVVDESKKHHSTNNGGEVDLNALANRFFDVYGPNRGYIDYVFNGTFGRLTKESLKNKLKIKLDDVKKYGRVPLFQKTTERSSGNRKVVVPLNRYKQLQSVEFLKFQRDIINTKDSCENDVTELMKRHAFWSWCTTTTKWKESTESQVRTACETILQQKQNNKRNKK